STERRRENGGRWWVWWPPRTISSTRVRQSAKLNFHGPLPLIKGLGDDTEKFKFSNWFFFRYVPGARWDPVTPFGGGLPARGGGRPGRHHGEPDPDHLPPPGSDDMFS
ncbi:hypothetical protein GBAR_LOCUS5873, partial [Geodia barretti]